MTAGYYNTTKEANFSLAEFERQAGRQDAVVVAYFAELDGRVAGPSTCYSELIERRLIDRETPLTSIRRSITNLTKQGLLEKTEYKQLGGFGRPEYCWRLAPPLVPLIHPKQLSLFKLA